MLIMLFIHIIHMDKDESLCLRELKFGIKGYSFLIEDYCCPWGPFYTHSVSTVSQYGLFSVATRVYTGAWLQRDDLNCALAMLMFDNKKKDVIRHWQMTKEDDDMYDVYISEDINKPFYALPGDNFIFPDSMTDEDKEAIKKYEKEWDCKIRLSKPVKGTSFARIRFGKVRSDKQIIWLEKFHKYAWFNPEDPDIIEQMRLNKEKEEMLKFY